MALSLSTLTSINVGLSRMMHFYTTADTAANIVGAGYFNGAIDRMKVGDTIVAMTDTGTTAVTKIHMVSAVSSTVVTLTAAA